MNTAIVLSCLAMLTLASRAAEDDWLEQIRVRHGVPGLAAAAMREGSLVKLAATGTREFGGSDAVTKDDLWHIGSCTKSITATLAGVMHDEGNVRWEMKIAEVLPELKDSVRGRWEAVTLEQLLTNRAGAPNQPPAKVWQAAWTATGSPVQQRLSFARGWLREKPEAEPGTKHIYSNQGFSLAGAMLERIGRKPYEVLVREKIFAPLGMKSAGFGAPGSASRVDQPRGHQGKPGAFTPVPPGKMADNPEAITPAGRVHCSIEDFAKFASWHARGPLRDVKLMSDETYRRLHTPPDGGEYAMGWVITERPWGGGQVLTHNGSNNMWFAVMWIAPEKQAAYVAATNCAGEVGAKVLDDAVASMILSK
jgi:CubicO group peptidase (beta-lactamase class C family)